MQKSSAQNDESTRQKVEIRYRVCKAKENTEVKTIWYPRDHTICGESICRPFFPFGSFGKL